MMMSSLVFVLTITILNLSQGAGFVQLSPRTSSLTVTEGGYMRVCVKAAISVPLHEFPVVLSISFKFFMTGRNNINLLKLKLKGGESQQCLEVAMQNITEKEFAMVVSVPGYDSIPTTTSQWHMTILSPGKGSKPLTALAVVEVCEGVDLVMPAIVEVPEGSTARLCITAKFPTCSLAHQHKVKLRVEDISTSFDDFDHSSIPHSILLDTSHSSQCLHIPTYSSNKGSKGGHKNFSIIATPGNFRAMVSLLKPDKRHVRQVSAGCLLGEVLPLLGGGSTHDGLVMMCSGNKYFPVDINTFTIVEASLVCRNLGLGSGGFPLSAVQDFGVHAFTRLSSISGRVQVQCSRGEASLDGCMVEVIYNSSLDAAGVSCRDAVNCKDGSIRLVPFNQDQMVVTEGRLEICFQGIWGAVFDKDWSPLDALVTCRQLGFRSSLDVIPLVPAIDLNSTNYLPIVYDSPACAVILQQPLLDCPRERVTPCPGQTDNAGSTRDLSGTLGQLTNPAATVGTRARSGVVGVRCSLQDSLRCKEFDVRLLSQEHTTSVGNLEICFQNSWHRICTNLFEGTDLNVACRSLGFVAYENISTVQHRFATPHVHNSNPPFLRKFNCSGVEEHFSECNNTEEMSCVSSLGIECLAPPQVTFHPSVKDGIYHVQENRSAFLECIVEEGSYPAVTNLTVSVTTSESGAKEVIDRAGVFPPYCLSATLYSTERAALKDSGQYSCVVRSGGLVTIHTVQVKIQSPSANGDARATEYLRFSAQNILPVSPEQLVYSSLSTNLPGQQLVQCHQVQRMRTGQAYDRYECAITTFALPSEDIAISVAEAAALLLNNLKPYPDICCINTSSSRFCDSEQTLVKGAEYSWPELAGGQSYILPCPGAHDGTQVVSRSCDSASGMWLPLNSSLCKSVLKTINDVLDQQVTAETYGNQVGVVASTLQRTVVEQSEQSGQVLRGVVNFVGAVAAVSEESNGSIPVQVLEGLVDSLSSLQQWQTGILLENRDTIARITNLFEQSATHFANQLLIEIVNVTIPDQIIFAAENVEVASLQRTGRTYLVRKNKFVASETLEDDLADDGITGSITLPSNLFASIQNKSKVGIFFTLYRDGALFQTRDPSIPALSSQKGVVGSPVVAASVVSDIVIPNITPPVLVQFRLNTPPSKGVRVNGSEVCVWWDYSAAEGVGSWSTEGCSTLLADSNDGIVECHCTHLTNFAILVDICSRLEGCEDNENPVLSKTLSFVTYIGTGFSMLGLIISVTTFLAFKRLRKQEASKVHLQLCVSLLCLLLVFVSGAEATEVYGGCVTVSVLLHYLTLTALLWMATEALFMCKKLVFVFHKNSSSFIIVVTMFCWGVPLVPVAIPLVVDLSQGPDPAGDLIIRRDAFCFLSHPVVFWAAFMGPVLAILLLNVVFYLVVVFILIRHTRSTLLRRQEGLTTKTTLRVMASIISILFLFGLTWLFAALTLTVHELRETAQILFTIFNSFQGVFLFLFFCLMNQEARESWKEFLSCGHYQSTVLRPHLRSISYEVNKKRSSVQSHKLHSVKAFDADKCYVSGTSSLTSSGEAECVHRTLPLPSTPTTPLPPRNDATTPTAGHSATPTLQQETNHTLNSITSGANVTGLQQSMTELVWQVLTPLGARVKRTSTPSQHVEEVQLDFLESNDKH